MSSSLTSDARFVQGKQLLKEKKFEEAVEFFSELLRSSCEQFGDKSLEVAPVWFEYGHALLSKEEDSPSNNLLGAAANEAKKAAQMLGEEDAEGDPDEEREDPPGESKVGDAGDDAEALAEEEEDIQMAWEALEVWFLLPYDN